MEYILITYSLICWMLTTWMVILLYYDMDYLSEFYDKYIYVIFIGVLWPIGLLLWIFYQSKLYNILYDYINLHRILRKLVKDHTFAFYELSKINSQNIDISKLSIYNELLSILQNRSTSIKFGFSFKTKLKNKINIKFLEDSRIKIDIK